MKVRIIRLLSAVLVAGAVGVPAPGVVSSAVAADKPAAQHVSSKLVKPLKAAQEAMQKQDWDTALAKTLEAKATGGLTPYDDYQINEFLSFIYLKKNDYQNAAVAYDAILASEFLPADQLEDRARVAATLNFQLKNYPKAVEYAKRWVEASGGSKPEPYMLLGQSYYVQNDYANAVKQIETGIDIAQRAGKPIAEQWLQLQLSCYAEMDNTAGMKKALEVLLREHPAPKYWDQMLTLVRNQRDADDRTTMNLYRLMYDMDQLKRPDDYVELAQYTFDAGIPGETVKVLKRGFERNLLGGKDEQRRRQFLADAEKQAQNDQKSLPTIEKEAAAAKTGDAQAVLGIAYLSYDQNDKAVEALQRGLEKGGVKRTDEARLMLGRALLKLNRTDDAVKAFQAIAKDSKLAELANLWAIYAQKGAGTPSA